jgi:hypothetical protein
MTAFEVGQKLVEMCKQGKFDEVVETLYSQDIVSIEAASAPGMPAEMRGLEAIRAKGKWWSENHTIHEAKCDGPWPNGDRFIVKFWFDITRKGDNQRIAMDEVGLYTVVNGKIIREEFFYQGG